MKTHPHNTSPASALPPRLVSENRALFRRRNPHLAPKAESTLSPGFWDTEPAKRYRAEQLLSR